MKIEKWSVFIVGTLLGQVLLHGIWSGQIALGGTVCEYMLYTT